MMSAASFCNRCGAIAIGTVDAADRGDIVGQPVLSQIRYGLRRDSQKLGNDLFAAAALVIVVALLRMMRTYRHPGVRPVFILGNGVSERPNLEGGLPSADAFASGREHVPIAL